MLLRKKMLSVKTMVELENWLESLPDDIQDLFDDNDMRLPKRLKLKVEYVPASKPEKLIIPLYAWNNPLFERRWNGQQSQTGFCQKTHGQDRYGG